MEIVKKKLEDDQDFLEENFSNLIFKSALKKNLSIFDDFCGLLTQKSILSLQNNCKKLKETFGSNFTQKNLVIIFLCIL